MLNWNKKEKPLLGLQGSGGGLGYLAGGGANTGNGGSGRGTGGPGIIVVRYRT